MHLKPTDPSDIRNTIAFLEWQDVVNCSILVQIDQGARGSVHLLSHTVLVHSMHIGFASVGNCMPVYSVK